MVLRRSHEYLRFAEIKRQSGEDIKVWKIGIIPWLDRVRIAEMSQLN
jgi:hypothetical protein